MKRLLAVAAATFGLLFSASLLAQNAPSNAVWVGVSVNLTNGTVSPPILEERIAAGGGGGGGIDTNAFIPKWPVWYQLATNGGIPPDLYVDGTTNYPSGMFKGIVDQGLIVQNQGNVQLRAIEGTMIGRPSVIGLLSSGGVKMTATNAGCGLALTNSSDGNFTVTWNGVTKTGWDAFIEKWPYTYSFATSSIPIPPVPYPYTVTNEYGVKITSGSPGVTLGLHSANKAGIFVPNAYFMLGGYFENGRGAYLSAHQFDISSPATVSSGDIKAASFTLGTNTITEWPPGGGGGGLTTARVLTTNAPVLPGDYLLWLDTRSFTSSNSVTLTLPDMDGAAQTIVVRRLGNDGAATIARGTNTWSLSYDGDGVTVDWLGAATNWFWRSF